MDIDGEPSRIGRMAKPGMETVLKNVAHGDTTATITEKRPYCVLSSLRGLMELALLQRKDRRLQ